MNKPTIRNYTMRDEMAYAYRREAIAFRYAAKVAAWRVGPDHSLVRTFRNEMREAAIAMIRNARKAQSLSL